MDISLHPLIKTDLELIRNWRNNPAVAQYMYTSDEISAEQQLIWYNKIQADESGIYWLIEYDNKKIGFASLTGINKLFSSCYWAFYLDPNMAKGAGIGSKIEFNVIEYVFNELKLNKLRCEVMVFNDKVISMHEKFGFRREAYYRQYIKKDGKWVDVVGLALLKDEWKTLKESMKVKIYRSI